MEHVLRQHRDDAGEDDQADPIADSAAGDLFAQPHQEHGAPGKGHDGRNQEEQAGILDQSWALRQADRNPEGLEDRQDDRQIAGILVEGLATRLAAFLAQLLPGRIDRTQQLYDDRRRDVGHHVQREDRHPLHGAAREHVEHAQDALCLAGKRLLECHGVDARDRDVGAQAINDHRHQGKPDALVKFRGLRKGPEVHVCGELFSGRSHSANPQFQRSLTRGLHQIGPGSRKCEAAGARDQASAAASGLVVVSEPPAFSTAARADAVAE